MRGAACLVRTGLVKRDPSGVEHAKRRARGSHKAADMGRARKRLHACTPACAGQAKIEHK